MHSPIIYLTILYIIGILIGKLLSLPLWLMFLLVCLALGAILWSILTKKNLPVLFFPIFFLIGLLNFQIRNLPPPQSDISNFPKDKYLTLIGRVEDEPGDYSFVFKVEKAGARQADGLVSAVGNIDNLKYGDRIEIIGVLEELNGRSNPGLLSYADFLSSRGIHCQFKMLSSPKVLGNGGSFFKHFIFSLRHKLTSVSSKTLPQSYADLLNGIVFGSSAAKTPAEVKELYKKAGVSHLLVASGMQLAILVGICLFFVRLTSVPLWVGVVIASVFNVAGALLMGFGASIIRAAIMAEIMLLGLLFEKEQEIYTSLSLAALITLLFYPHYLFEAGFQLSFSATWALVYISPVLNEKLKIHMPQSLSALISAAASPVLATIPVTLYHFSQFSLVGVATNIILLPWVGVLVILGFAASMLGAIFLPLGELINVSSLILLWAADKIIAFFGALPFAEIVMAPPGFPLLFAYYLGLIGLMEIIRRGRFPKLTNFRLAIFVLCLLGIFLWSLALGSITGGLTITVLDVGQGDSILIETPGGRKMLIDGGEGKTGERLIVPFLRRNGIRKLDLVILTHPHDDHVGGLVEVLSDIKVDSVLEPGSVYESESYRRFLDLIRKNKIKYYLARAGQILNFGKNIKAEVFHPSLPFLSDTNSDANNCSVVFKLVYDKFSMLFTGDNEKEGEERILEMFPSSSLASTVLKVGHHGSGTSTSDRFLEAVNPGIAVISCGRHNKFRHPHKSTLEKLQSKGIKTYRTDQQGAVTIQSDGRRFAIAPQKLSAGSPLQK